VSLHFSIPITLRCLGHGFHTVPDEETEREPSDQPPRIDYAPLVDATRRVGLWLLDVARSRTTDPLDLTAIERVQRSLLTTLAGKTRCARSEASEEDLLTVAGILITAFEVECGAPGLSDAAGALYSATDGDVSQIAKIIVDALVASALQSAAEITTRPRPTKHRAHGLIPIIVRDRPRVLDEDVLADLLANR
jgi:hypothetical protein